MPSCPLAWRGWRSCWSLSCCSGRCGDINERAPRNTRGELFLVYDPREVSVRAAAIDSKLQALDQLLLSLRTSGQLKDALGRWRAAAGALRFHLRDRGKRPPIVAVLGGTGTGKSTIVN